MREVEGTLQERRPKSRTPTKIKGDTKKSKNKWTVQQQQPENSSPKKTNQSVQGRLRSASLPDLSVIQSIELPRLCLMRVPNSKLKPKTAERVL